MKIGISYVLLGVLILIIPENAVSYMFSWTNEQEIFDFALIALIFFAALFEAIFLIGWSFPGSVIILIATVVSQKTGVGAFWVCGSGIFGISIGYYISLFYVGTKGQLRKLSIITYLIEAYPSITALTFSVLPQFGAILAYSVGQRGNRKKYFFFLLVCGTIFWVTIIYFILFYYGDQIVDYTKISKDFLAVLPLAYGLIEIALHFKKNKTP